MIPDSRAHDGPVLNIDYDIIKNSARGLMDQAVASVTLLWHILPFMAMIQNRTKVGTRDVRRTLQSKVMACNKF